MICYSIEYSEGFKFWKVDSVSIKSPWEHYSLHPLEEYRDLFTFEKRTKYVSKTKCF